ncbi:hypothetical protein L6258_03990, partial [Candidatus Parcubacteria bacterium]|nr:hypothetical protein [Candidatus Parcubacteria bacterium]
RRGEEMKNLFLIALIVILILAFVPDTWLGKVAGVGGPKVTEVVLKVSGWIKGFKSQLVGLVRRQPKLVDPKTGEPWPPGPIPLAPERDGVSAKAMEPSGGGGIPGGEPPSGWGDKIKKVLPYALLVLVGLIVVVGGGFVISKIRARPGVETSDISGMFLPEGFEPTSMSPAEPSFPGFYSPASSPLYAAPSPAVSSQPLSGLAKEWAGRLLFAWAFAVLCLVASKLPIVPLVWQQTAGFFVSFSLLGVTPFVVLMFTGEVMSSTLAPLATGAGRIFGDAGRSVVILINYTIPLVALVVILLLLVAKTGGNVVNFAAGTGAPAVSKMAVALTAVTAGDPLNVALICLSFVGYILIVMKRAF